MYKMYKYFVYTLNAVILLLISDLGVIHSRVDDGVTLGQDRAVTLLAIILS